MATEHRDAIQVHTKVGEALQIKIWEDRTKGGCRYVPTYDSAALRLLADEYERTRNIRVTDSGMRTFEFLGMAPGKTTIEFEARYGWKFSLEDRLVYEVIIAD